MTIIPQFDPVAIHLSFISPTAGIHWYGITYLVAFALFWWLGRRKANRLAGWQPEQVDDLLFYGVLGVILGGRLGYVLFYKLSEYMANPLEILQVWHGGMAFHGGFLGVLVAMWLFARKFKHRWLEVTDFIAPLVPLGLASGRIGNFINHELLGRVTDANAWWAVIFSGTDPLPRHASQLYQFALEGISLFVILAIYSRKPRTTGYVSALFLGGYGVFRFIAEFAREPDRYLGLGALGLSRGQWLCVPMIVGAIGLAWYARRQAKN